MITGTLILEDSQLHFHYTEEGKISATIADGLTGNQATLTLDPHQFAASLALAFAPDAFESDPKLNETLYAYAGQIPFPSNELRWIP